MLSLNVAPYFDDFDAAKNYHKILFIPGNPVQARELTQIQSILQNQIKMQGDHIFQNGTMVIPGNVYFDAKVTAIKLKKLYSAADVNDTLPDLVDATITSNITKVSAKVIWYEKGTATTNPYIFVKYTTGNGSIDSFTKDEILSVNNVGMVEIDSGDDYSAPGAVCHIREGVFYINGYFIGVDNQTVTVSTSLTDTTAASVGLQLVEQIITAADDSSLYDNAQGYNNFSAPGADRYKISLSLVKTNYNDTVDTQSFIKLLDIIDGQIAYLNNRTQYSEINKMLARRTYDESGDFVVTAPKDIIIKSRFKRRNYDGDWVAGKFYMRGDHVTYTGPDSIQRVYYTVDTGVSGVVPPTHLFGKVSDGVLNWTQVEPKYVATNNGAYFPTDATTSVEYDQDLQVTVGPLKAYVKGFEVETQTTRFTVNKTLTTKTKTDNIQVPAGEYVLVNTIAGSGALDISTVQAGVIKDSTSTQIGTCWIRSLEKDTGSNYRLYIFGIVMNTGKTFTDHAQKIAVGTTFTCNIALQNFAMSGLVSAAGGSGAVTGKMTRFTAELSIGSSITIGANTYIVSNISSDSSLTCSTNVTAVTDAPAIAKVADYNNNSNSYVIPMPALRLKSLRDASNNLTMTYVVSQYKAFGVASGTTASISLTGNDSFVSGGNHIVFETNGGVTSIVSPTISYANNNTQMTLSGLTNGRTYNAICIISRIADATKEKTKTLKTKTIIVDDTQIYDAATNIQITANYNYKSVSFPTTEADVVRIISVKVSGDATPGNPYSATNEIDVSNKFTCHDYTTAEYYGMPMMVRNSDAPAIHAPIKVTFEYFDHTTGDFFSKNSYTEVLDTMIPTLNGNVAVTIADTLDFRPRMDDTGTGWNTANTPTGGAVLSSPLLSGSTINVAYTYYLPRLDVISIGVDGALHYTEGKAADWNGLAYPPIDGNQLILAQVFVAPNPYNLTADFTYKLLKYRRYTMSDIGKLDDRITNVEQYVAMSLLEKQAADLSIKDENGMDRFKNGIIVDNFTSSAVAAIDSPDFTADMNTTMYPATMSPIQYTDHIKLIELTSSNVGRAQSKYAVTGSVATLPYTVKAAISQKVASTPEFINPFNVVLFEGVMTITPPEDVWTTETLTQNTVYV